MNDETRRETCHGYSAAQTLRCGDRDAVREALLIARGRTLALAAAYTGALAHSGMQIPYRASLNPPLWEWGHLAWFQEFWVGRNQQRARGIACEPEHARLAPLLDGADALFDSSRVAHRLRWELPLPDAAGVHAYLQATLTQTLRLLDELPSNAGDDALYFFRLTALHEDMHAEAACYMARTLGFDVSGVPLREAPAMRPGPAVIHISAQSHVLGWRGAGFAFDNELQAHQVELGAFDIDAQPVSWEQFLQFEEAGGYDDRGCWDEAGWAWLQKQGGPERRRAVRALGDGALQRSGAAVHLSAHEAQAWCRWAGRRLPTEAEWECAAVSNSDFRWGQVWEWTSSTFEPYPGFQPHPYRDYSMPWFGTRRVLRGACPATSPSLAHPRYRNFFEPDRIDIFSGFRSCRAGNSGIRV